MSDEKNHEFQLSRVEQLQIAGYMAPRVRSGSHRRSRPIKVVGKDGQVTREIDSDELNKKS